MICQTHHYWYFRIEAFVISGNKAIKNTNNLENQTVNRRAFISICETMIKPTTITTSWRGEEIHFYVFAGYEF